MRHVRRIGVASAFVAVLTTFGMAQTAPAPTATPAEAPAPAPPETPTPAAAPQAPVEAPAPAPTAAPTPVPTTIPPTPVPMFAPPRRLVDVPMVSISRLSGDNPYGIATEEPASLPPKPPFPEVMVPAPLFAAVRVDPTGRVVASRIVRDPIPSLAAESRRSFEQRWSFDPATRGGQPVDAWASVRLDLQVEVRPREEQATLSPVTPSTPLPVPSDWGDDTLWYESYRVNAPADGTVPLEQVEKAPVPRKTKWGADSYKGPFSCRVWIRINAAGRVDKLIPIQASDPVLIPYMRKVVSTWAGKPARLKGQAVDSWNDLSITGTLSYSIEVRQVNNLKKTLATP
jgi:hypothetical protein